MEILDLRHFRSSDLRSLLEEESRAWSRLLSWDYSGSAEMILRYMDARILPGYAWVENNLVQGYSFFVYEGSKGVIGDLFVHPTHSGQGQYSIEERLLGHVIETLQQSPGINRIEAQLLLHETASMERPFIEEGFRRHPRLFMVLPLNPGSGNGNHSNQHLADVEFRKWSDEDFQGAASVITTAYRDHIDSEINDQYRTSAGSLRFLNNIIRFPGCGLFDPEASIMARSRSTRAPLGVILCSRVRSDVGHVTQVCVAPEYRGRGLGKALMCMACSELQKRGCRALSLTVTEANAPAVNLYKHMGFAIHRIFDAFVWEG
ncbi:MAG TPA: GNAT family N-acetyltransferase [Terriglobales bacterium]|nr:GNAT family N-acetyltransferase [Terriglobales bacterium]